VDATPWHTGLQKPRSEQTSQRTPLSAAQTRKYAHLAVFEGSNYPIDPTFKSTVILIHHLKNKLRVVEHPPKDIWPPILAAFTLKFAVHFCSGKNSGFVPSPTRKNWTLVGSTGIHGRHETHSFRH
jgi:hypothetical protein